MSNANNGVLDGLRRIGGRFRDLTIDGGIPGASLGFRMRGATASGPPATGTWKTGEMVPDRTGTIWVCAAGGTPGTWIREGDQPYQFRPETYGAQRNGKLLTDGAMAVGNVLTSVSASFGAADLYKYVLVWGAITSTNSEPGYLFAQVTQVNSSSSVTLSASATIAVSGTGVLIGTDDTAALQAAINAATTYSLNGNGALGQVLLSEGIYCSGTQASVALGTASTTLNNAVIQIPDVSPTSGPKAQIQIIGVGSSQLPHWTQPVPVQSGSIIAAMRTDGSLNSSPGYGPTTIMGGPVLGYGGGNGTFSNMHILLKGFTVLVPMSAGAYAGPDLFAIGQATVDDLSYLPIAVIPTSTTWPALNPASGIVYGSPTYYPTYTFALRMPTDGNNAIADIGSFTSYFTFISLVGSEHTTFTSLKSLFSEYGILPTNNHGGTTSHGITGLHWCCQAVRYPVGSTGSGYWALDAAIGIVVARLDIESDTQVVYDAASSVYGEIGINYVLSATSYLSNQYASGSGTGVKLKRIEAQPGPIASFSGSTLPPATGVAWPNYFYRDAWITLSVSSGFLTGLEIDSTAQAGLSSSTTTYSFLLPSGHSYTPTYTVPSSLTHTVSLL